MKRLIITVAIFVLPVVALVSTYVITDVFRVIYTYDPYYVESYRIDVNRAYGSTMTYINQNPIYHYNSFIFGNSRSLLYEIDTWKKYLPEGSECMHYDESVGSICGIRDKVSFIDKSGGEIDNALLVIDHDLLSHLELEQGYLFISPPILKDNSNFWNFHKQHFSAFINFKFLTALIDFSVFGKYRSYMKGLIRDSDQEYISRYNEIRKTKAEEEISKGTYFNTIRVGVFDGHQKPGTYSSEVIDPQGIEYMREVKAIFDKHNTSYKIIISPLYDQVKLNPKTYNILCSIFGDDKIYDFSGVNKWNQDYHNYYETSHYRPSVSSEIMEIVYTGSQDY